MTSWLWGACSTEVLYSLPKLNRYFFVLLVCHLPVIDGFDWHFHISVHFTLSSSINRSQQHWKIQEINLPEVQKLNQGLLGEKLCRSPNSKETWCLSYFHLGKVTSCERDLFFRCLRLTLGLRIFHTPPSHRNNLPWYFQSDSKFKKTPIEGQQALV